ncbi:hypothetical protein SAMN02745216_04802 [Desulfatibacillum alkenivorans DSM 16219]|jgi:hypothetical protein|uniref:PAS domain-containing protein n=1 Tax=Desulfatibacillum alkenivorans DSM 16219 TaxID=1121393 RepID=A0A1M6YP85_9BACT|nr:hypothetical protein [Desulfatibacillum alkenivorans]SHL20066.1 hypothetical protein SAMN02745216_04802 [Desulfatibacillum alkenivorans DSM 16219]
MELKAFYDYINSSGTLLFFRLDSEGRILSMNQCACQICGEHVMGEPFQNIILDFQDIFNVREIRNGSECEKPFSIQTVQGSPETYLLEFTPAEGDILVFGRKDFDEMELLKTEVMSLNQELGNLSRTLHKKNAELQNALDHVKTLQGIIPICMHCHKIRDEKQIWDRLEKYLTEHTYAELSHSICPECLERLYPDIDDDDEC